MHQMAPQLAQQTSCTTNRVPERTTPRRALRTALAPPPLLQMPHEARPQAVTRPRQVLRLRMTKFHLMGECRPPLNHCKTTLSAITDKHNASGAEDSPAHISIGAQHEAVSTPSIGPLIVVSSFTEERSATFTSPLVTSSPSSIVGSTPASTAATAPAERASA